jgi:hypothetical protein
VLTTIGASVRTILSGRVARGAFLAVKALSGGSARPLPHRISGPLVMSAVALVWILGIWLGWTLVFLSDAGSVTWSEDGGAAGFWGVFGHAGRQVSTLGSGATDPEGTTWYIVGVLGAISGMIVMTLGVSFILTTTATVTGGRALCGLSEALDVADPEAATTLLPGLAEVVAGLNSAPFALYYSSSEPTRRLPNRLAVLARRASVRREAMALYRPVLNDLPNLEVYGGMDDRAYADAVERWSRDYEIAPMTAEEIERAAAREGS